MGMPKMRASDAHSHTLVAAGNLVLVLQCFSLRYFSTETGRVRDAVVKTIKKRK